MGKARYICFEGTEGVGKTTQCNLLAQKLIMAGHKVLLTKEPGSIHAPLTMVLRQVMLDKQFDNELTIPARELVSQAIRSIHLERVILPNMDKYDFIIQDRGMLSGLAYGVGCGNDEAFIKGLMTQVSSNGGEIDNQTYRAFHDPFKMYTDVVYLQGNIAKGLATALSAKQEFKAGDAIEAKGVGFMQNVARNMQEYSKDFHGVRYIHVDGKTIEEVSMNIMEALELTEGK